jgi:hypothetical protein
MALVDPVKTYVGTSNVESQMILRLLQSAGIEAFAGEDVSPAGLWMGGTIPGIFDAGVYVSRDDAEQAIAAIRRHERLEAERTAGQGAEMEVTCDECGKVAAFPAAQRGTVQDCPHCGAYLDVGEGDLPGDWGAESEDGEDHSQPPEGEGP